MFSDFISEKGKGCIFLLHGKPGTGKTLTAESIAEMLKTPLYSISVGELGMDIEALEKKLKEILEVSSSWNAVILLDEADVFLEKRTENDIVRNAMIGVFLRILEYHQGVMFLTTNRVRCFDSAVFSRVSVAVKYDDLEESAREQVWKNMLAAAGLDSNDVEKGGELGHWRLNGREIRNVLRLARTLAITENVPMNKAHLERTMKLVTDFHIETLAQ